MSELESVATHEPILISIKLLDRLVVLELQKEAGEGNQDVIETQLDEIYKLVGRVAVIDYRHIKA